MKLALLMRHYLRQMDERIFKQSAPIILFKEKTIDEIVDNQTYFYPFRYSPKYDCYLIYAYVEDMITSGEGEFECLFSLQPFSLIFERYHEFFPHNDLKEIIFGCAAHEVRHRVQSKLRIGLIGPSDKEKAVDPLLKCIIEFNDLLFTIIKKKEPSFFRDEKEFRKEFDANVIRFVASWIFNKRKDWRLFDEVSQFIKREAKFLLQTKIRSNGS